MRDADTFFWSACFPLHGRGFFLTFSSFCKYLGPSSHIYDPWSRCLFTEITEGIMGECSHAPTTWPRTCSHWRPPGLVDGVSESLPKPTCALDFISFLQFAFPPSCRQEVQALSPGLPPTFSSHRRKEGPAEEPERNNQGGGGPGEQGWGAGRWVGERGPQPRWTQPVSSLPWKLFRREC